MSIPLYILPGESRSKDRIVPAAIVKVEFCRPSNDRNPRAEYWKFRPAFLKVTVSGEETKDYPFILPCDFHPEWETLEDAAQDMGLDLAVIEPVQDSDSIGRAVIRSWFATADGSVYTSRSTGRVLLTEKWPVLLDDEWFQHHQVERSERREFEGRCG